jgi:membrane-bound lytic murein transglycosylase D
MAWNAKTYSSTFFGIFLAFSGSLLQAQQSNLQTSFFAPAAIRMPATGALADIAETEHLPYIKQVSKDSHNGFFQPNPSDLLIQQAEESFRKGKQFYQDRDFAQARTAFDNAIEFMLRASENPTSRPLFETKFEEMVDNISHMDLSGMGAMAAESEPQFDKAPLDDIVQMTFPVDPKMKTRVASEVGSTVSALPLVVNDVVLGYINYFNGRGRKTIQMGIERSGKYRDMISRVLAEEGVPQELIHLAQAESGFLPRAVSRAAAEGMWQFVKFRGNQYGLMQTPYSDERLDPEKATRAAARHLHDLYKEFNDWYLAIAAYNCGPGNIEKAVERTGYADFWELRARHAIPAETANYVPIILAMTIMSKNAHEYGLDQVQLDPSIEYDTVSVDSPTNLALVSDLADAPITQLQQLNPALLRGMIPAGFALRVPKGTGAGLTATLEQIPADRRPSWRIHRVQSGETLAQIAHEFHSSSTAIAAANRLTASDPNAGDRLLIPAAYHETALPLKTFRAGRTTHRGGRRVIARSAGARTGSRSHVVQSAAKRPLHRSSATLAQLNHRSHTLNR